MDNLIRFPSVTNPAETGYTVYASASDGPDVRRSPNALAPWAAAWPTYGDGMVQHGPDYPPQAEALGDFLGSLASYLADNPAAVEVVARHWPRDAWAEDVRFYRSLRWKAEGKRKYYEPRERKVSTVEAKRHDKRWHELPEWADGSVGAIVGLVYKHSWVEPGLIARLALYRAVKQALDVQEGADAAPYFNAATALDASDKPLMGSADREENWRALQTFDAVDEFVRAFRARESAARSLDCWRANVANAARRAAEKAQQAAPEVA